MQRSRKGNGEKDDLATYANRWRGRLHCQNFRELRTVPNFATAHTFCASGDGPRKSGFLTAMPDKTEIFLRGS